MVLFTGLLFIKSKNLASPIKEDINEQISSFKNEELFDEKLKIYISLKKESDKFNESRSFFKKFGEYSIISKLYETTIDEFEEELNQVLLGEYNGVKYVKGLSKLDINQRIDRLVMIKEIISTNKQLIVDKDEFIQKIDSEISYYEEELKQIEKEEKQIKEKQIKEKERIKAKESSKNKEEQKKKAPLEKQSKDKSSSSKKSHVPSGKPKVGALSPYGYKIISYSTSYDIEPISGKKTNFITTWLDSGDNVWDDNWKYMYNMLDYFEKVPS